MPEQFWLAVLSSSLVSGVLGALIGGWFTLRGKRNDYANEYYKLVVSRRLAACEQIERLIVMLKMAVLDADKRPYHLMFSKDDDVEAVYKLLFGVMSNALWISDELFESTRELNLTVLRHGSSNSGLVEFGKANYARFAELRTKIEKAHLRDMLSLHDVPRFLKNKKPNDSYRALEAEN
jgi:hypothetical protein